jgi:glycosyltransferase involved in cell wall biosynthesis
MACGKPVVTSDFPGARALVTDGQNGFIQESRNSTLFAAALDRAMGLPLAAAASPAVAARHDFPAMAGAPGRAWSVLA